MRSFVRSLGLLVRADADDAPSFADALAEAEADADGEADGEAEVSLGLLDEFDLTFEEVDAFVLPLAAFVRCFSLPVCSPAGLDLAFPLERVWGVCELILGEVEGASVVVGMSSSS